MRRSGLNDLAMVVPGSVRTAGRANYEQKRLALFALACGGRSCLVQGSRPAILRITMQIDSPGWNISSMILTWQPMTPSPRRMLMAIPVVVVPDGADVARVGFEEESGDGVDACRRRAADRTRRGSGRIGHRPLPLVRRPAVRAGIVVFRHGSRIGQEHPIRARAGRPGPSSLSWRRRRYRPERPCRADCSGFRRPHRPVPEAAVAVAVPPGRLHRQTGHRRDRRRDCCRAGCDPRGCCCVMPPPSRPPSSPPSMSSAPKPP